MIMTPRRRVRQKQHRLSGGIIFPHPPTSKPLNRRYIISNCKRWLLNTGWKILARTYSADWCCNNKEGLTVHKQRINSTGTSFVWFARKSLALSILVSTSIMHHPKENRYSISTHHPLSCAGTETGFQSGGYNIFFYIKFAIKSFVIELKP